ncbi:DHH family phosphoesterase [Hyunsoonleella ulvae]|uniref:DHH family phosphoesterase n=1 Tax=Hyunsoonleella ulvae TaxID=2799948 RepID=UPI00193AB336|nr:bifunctional oligoribonuclease/PAP phosphatase NrnA [Hyunsoonleella ulvae]
MDTNDITAIKQLLSTPKHIVVVPHKNPDGDAIGSTLGLSHFLKKYHHNIQVITPNDYPEFLKWVPGENTILKYDSQTEACNKAIENADIVFTLDFNAFHRTGAMEPILKSSTAIKILIDHHEEPDNYAKYSYSDVSMSSTCEMIYHFIDMLGSTDKVDAEIATCLYLGIMTDTGSFRFPSTTSTTHRIVAELIDKGAKNADIHNNVFDTNSYNRLQLLGCALSNLKVLPELRTAYITLSQEELRRFDYKKGDTEGVVNYALSLENIIFAAIFIEDKQEGIIKISLRSKGNFSVNEFSRAHFNGGGHNNAAGGRSETSLRSTVEKFLSILPPYKDALNHE